MHSLPKLRYHYTKYIDGYLNMAMLMEEDQTSEYVERVRETGARPVVVDIDPAMLARGRRRSRPRR